MIIATTGSIEGKVPVAYLGIVAAEIIFGANFIKDWLASGDDFWGGRVSSYEKVFRDARNAAQEELKLRAKEKGANGVLNVRFAYNVLGESNGMMMVAATGTAVLLTLTADEKKRAEEADRLQEATHWLRIQDKIRGPFSIEQLRELVQAGKIAEDTRTCNEDGVEGDLVGSVTADEK